MLDCGAGTGALSLALAAAHTRPLRIEAVDLSQAMLARAARGFAAAGIATHLYRGDARALPFPTNAFDLVMSAHMLEHLSDPVPTLREILRVLKPGAPLLLLVTQRSLLGAWLQLRWRVHRVGEREIRTWLGRCGVTDVGFYSLDGARWPRWMSLACLARKR